MRAFLRRLGICAWLLWAGISLIALVAALYRGISDHSQTYDHRSYSNAPAVPWPLIEAYRKNELTAEKREFFIRAVVNDELNLSPGDEISVPRSFSERWEIAGGVILGAGFFALLLIMTQYLVVGHPNPVRLFKNK